VIDLVIAEHESLNRIGEFQVWEDDLSIDLDLSDHRLVSFEFDLSNANGSSKSDDNRTTDSNDDSGRKDYINSHFGNNNNNNNNNINFSL
jgi:hypothetical protein